MKEHANPSMSGSLSGYTVEARWAYPEPKQFAGIILDKEWRKVPFVEGQHGVPQKHNLRDGSLFLNRFGLYTKAAAEALRWWFIAEAQTDGVGAICLETRIVEHRVMYSATAERAEPFSYQPAKAAEGETP